MNTTMKKTGFKTLNAHSGPCGLHTNDRISDFLVKALEEYGDKKEDVLKCLDYVFNGTGGNIILALENDDIVGAVVLNNTGMTGYIPENILVYIAVDPSQRGKGLGKQLMEHAIKVSKGDIALHVEANNPAKFLYEKMGFTNPYLEMRLKRS